MPAPAAFSNLVVGDSNGVADIFLWNRQAGTLVRQPAGVDGEQPTGASSNPVPSYDGQVVALVSLAYNLAAGDSNLGHRDTFVWKRATGTYERQPLAVGDVSPNGATSAPSISTSGALIAVTSLATNLVAGDTNGATDVFVWVR